MAKNFISNVSLQYQYFDIQLGHPDWDNKKVLDFGGNVGNMLTDPNCKIKKENYWCLDVSRKAIEIGQKKYQSASFNFYDCYNLSFNPTGVADLPIPDLGVKFDYILAYSIFTHIVEEEMRDKVNQLLSFLSEKGILIFTFLEAEYNGSEHYPGFQDIQNIEKRLRNLNNGILNEELISRSQGVQSMALVNGTNLYTRNQNVVELPRKEGDTLFTYYTPEYLKSIYNCEIKQPPRETYSETYPAEMQHSCIIKKRWEDMIVSNQVIKTENIIIPEETYLIGIYSGNNPFDLKPHETIENPIVSRKDFKKNAINFVADPFAIFENDTWYLFYEGMGSNTRKGKIYVTTSTDLKNWTPSKVILEESFHLSYPQVFKHKDQIYMIPESFESKEVRLYISEDFPLKWKFEKMLLPISCVDSTLLIQDDIFWIFTCDAPISHNRLRLFYSDDLHGDWVEHPQSPIHVDDSRNSRPAGKIFKYENKLFRVAQNCKPFYGHSVKAFEINTINKVEYSETELMHNPILKGGDELWNRISMHHIDLHEIEKDYWIAFVDGRRN